MSKRRAYDEIESSVVNALKKFRKEGASVSQISIEAKTNWRTTNEVIGRLRHWGVVRLMKDDKRLKIYKWNI
ncbi:MAG: hypothetical protein ABIG39_03500 [Candidatus Micrarchaeota archaeon]